MLVSSTYFTAGQEPAGGQARFNRYRQFAHAFPFGQLLGRHFHSLASGIPMSCDSTPSDHANTPRLPPRVLRHAEAASAELAARLAEMYGVEAAAGRALLRKPGWRTALGAARLGRTPRE